MPACDERQYMAGRKAMEVVLHKNTNFYQSLTYALSGFFYAVRHERNLRFHIAAAVGVALFGFFYGLDRIEWAVLVAVFGTVISSELVNTAVENAVDTATREYDPYAKAAKDTAAAAVLVSAAVSVVTGVCIFADTEKIIRTVREIVTTPVDIAVFAVVAAADILFLIFGGIRKSSDGKE
jgi:undecaprenol kinase